MIYIDAFEGIDKTQRSRIMSRWDNRPGLTTMKGETWVCESAGGYTGWARFLYAVMVPRGSKYRTGMVTYSDKLLLGEFDCCQVMDFESVKELKSSEGVTYEQWLNNKDILCKLLISAEIDGILTFGGRITYNWMDEMQQADWEEDFSIKYAIISLMTPLRKFIYYRVHDMRWMISRITRRIMIGR